MAAGVVRAGDPAQDLEDQYQAAVAVLKKPTVTGLVITEVAPESAAAARGIRAGDVLLEYYGKKITTLQELSDQVAEAVGRTIAEDVTGKQVVVRLQRGNDVLAVQLP